MFIYILTNPLYLQQPRKVVLSFPVSNEAVEAFVNEASKLLGLGGTWKVTNEYFW